MVKDSLTWKKVTQCRDNSVIHYCELDEQRLLVVKPYKFSHDGYYCYNRNFSLDAIETKNMITLFVNMKGAVSATKARLEAKWRRMYAKERQFNQISPYLFWYAISNLVYAVSRDPDFCLEADFCLLAARANASDSDENLSWWISYLVNGVTKGTRGCESLAQVVSVGETWFSQEMPLDYLALKLERLNET